MKKIMLFSLTFCGIFLLFNGADAAKGSDCKRTSTGAIICGSIPVGGPMESSRCQEKSGVYAEVGTTCNPRNAPDGWGHCIESVVPNQTSCAAEKCNDDYLLYTTNTRREISVIETKERVGSQGICTSRQQLKNFCEDIHRCHCDDDKYRCVLNEVHVDNHISNKKKTGLTEVPAYIGEDVCICVEKTCAELYPNDESKRACCEAGKTWDEKNNTCPCEDGQEWRKQDGTWKCVAKKQKENKREPEKKSNCWFRLNVDVTCADGSSGYKANEIYYLTEAQAKEMKCKAGQLFEKDNFTGSIAENVSQDVKAAKEILKLVCGTGAGTGGASGSGGTTVSPTVTPTQPSGMDIETAKNTLNKFFREAKDNASVWKTEDGKFNTARLASDLTAGVVLGTVGGVVSANIIKKNQIKKGYEVLHCTIGGQTVADWGDEFNTGLRR